MDCAAVVNCAIDAVSVGIIVDCAIVIVCAVDSVSVVDVDVVFEAAGDSVVTAVTSDVHNVADGVIPGVTVDGIVASPTCGCRIISDKEAIKTIKATFSWREN